MFTPMYNWLFEWSYPEFQINVLTDEASVPVEKETVEKIKSFVRASFIRNEHISVISVNVMLKFHNYGVIINESHKNVDVILL